MTAADPIANIHGDDTSIADMVIPKNLKTSHSEKYKKAKAASYKIRVGIIGWLLAGRYIRYTGTIGLCTVQCYCMVYTVTSWSLKEESAFKRRDCERDFK